jgi:nitrogen fixation NifU-like protein
MMDDVRELYQEVILDHSRRPRNYGEPLECNRCAHGENPLCGDKITVFLTIKDSVVEKAAFDGRGCAISIASASLMTEMMTGMTVEDARDLFSRFHELVAGDPAAEADWEELDKLAVLSGVRAFPVRVKCATLAWHTLNAALRDRADTVSTE